MEKTTHCSSFTLPENPLLVDVVLESVFKYLDAKTLKISRQVCKSWNKIATVFLLHETFFQNFYERVHSENFQALTEFINIYSSNSFHNLHIHGLNCMKLYSELNLLGTQLKRLKYYRTSFETEEASVYGLLRLLTENQFPNLSSLYLDVTHDYDDENEYENEIPPEHHYINIFSLPKLRRLVSYKNHPNDIINSDNNNKNYTNQQKGPWEKILLQRFGNLRELHLRSFDAISKGTLENLMTIPWNLTKFEVTVDNRVPCDLIRTFLCKINATLKELSISFSFSYEGYNYDVSNPTQDNWLIPTSLFHLKKLKIETERSNDVNTLVRSLITALQLPSLKIVKLYGECLEGSYGRMVFPLMWDLQSKSIQVVKIGAHFLDTSVFLRPIKIMPHLKELTLYFPTIEIISSVFMTFYDTLEKLHLELKNDKGVDWESVLTGIPTEKNNKSMILDNYSKDNPVIHYQDQSQNQRHPSNRASIRYLKNLKCLKIEFPEFSPEFYFTDFFLYNGLFHLKELQYLYIRGEKFSHEALEDLKKELRPFANISLIKYESPYEDESSIIRNERKENGYNYDYVVG